MRFTTEVTVRSRADSADVAALSPADIALHQETAGSGRNEPPRRWTIIATVLGHLLVLALFVIDWQTRPEPAPAPEPIPVRLVMLPPKPEPAPPPTPPARPAQKRESGPDQETTAPPPATVEGPKASPVPETPPPITEKPPEAPPAAAEKPPEAPPPMAEKPPEAPAIAAEKPPEPSPASAAPEHVTPPAAPKPKPKKIAIPARPKEAPKEAREPTDRMVALAPPGRAPGKQARSGDRYLNALRDRIERNRTYPPPEMFGAIPAAMAVYQVVVDRSGNLMGVKILQSTGISKFDELAGLMIRDAAPFPPLPPDYPEVRALLTIAIPLYPAQH